MISELWRYASAVNIRGGGRVGDHEAVEDLT